MTLRPDRWWKRGAQHPLAGPWAAGRRCPHSLACLGLAAPVSNLPTLAIWLQLQS